MSQHPYVINNQSGASFRADLNNCLQAIVTTNSGNTQPTATFAYMLWADSANDQLKVRNAANNAWIVVGKLSAVNLGLIGPDGGTFNANATLNADTGTGTKIGGSNTQKLGFWGATPVARQTTSVGKAAFVENPGGTDVNANSTIGGYTLAQIVQALQNVGILT